MTQVFCPEDQLKKKWHKGPKTSEAGWSCEAGVGREGGGRPRVPCH